MRRDELSLPLPPSTDRPGDRWVCGHSGDQSPCPHGPSFQGICPLADQCRPRRSWHGARKRMGMFAGLVTVGVVVAILLSRSSATVFKPGDLATPHAQILAGTLTSQRCASCHPNAATSPQIWFASGQEGHQDVDQTDRCLDCHHTTIDRSTAKLAHNLPRRVRAQLRLASARQPVDSWHDLLPGPAVDQENVQCNACHREHRGAQADLLAVTDSQCQTCHSDRFGRFAQSHPEWRDWPYGRGGTIAFNHASHANKHFPATVRGSEPVAFQCNDCHVVNRLGELSRTVSYERGCQSCHDDVLRVESAEGIELLALPTLPQQSADSLERWPQSATGFYDGKVSPLADLMMRANREVASALRLIPDHDFGSIEPRRSEQVAAGETIARATRQLLEDMSQGGQQVFLDRAGKLGIVPSTLVPFVHSLPPQLLSEAHQRWFHGGTPTKLSSESDRGFNRGPTVRQIQFRKEGSGLSAPSDSELDSSSGSSLGPSSDSSLDGSDDDDLLLVPEDSAAADDPLLEDDDLLITDGLLDSGDALQLDPLLESPLERGPKPTDSPRRFEPDQMIPAGGWYRDDVTMAIRYRGGDHHDPVLKSTIELISQLPPADPARRHLLKRRAVAACVVCHPGAVLSKGAWESQPLIGRRSDLTKFTHGPHLNVAQLTDCTHCHTVASGAVESISQTGATAMETDFNPLGREACAACHSPHAAGDACVKCHRYHIDSP